MHDKIKELVKRAGGHISMRNLASNPVQHIESVELWDDRIEKFAELIVKDCADYVQFYYKDHMCEVIAHDMKTHFGVK
jgi:hypothetical protein